MSDASSRSLAPPASEVRQKQAARLARLRVIVRATQVEAADAAGVSRDAWGRMERGEAEIGLVALTRFTAAFQVAAEYVATGEYHGLSSDTVRRLAALDTDDEARCDERSRRKPL